MASLKDRFLYGASGTRAPQTEEEPRPQGGDMLKRFIKNFGCLIQFNLVSAAFMIPAIAWSGVNFILMYELLTESGSLSAILLNLSLWLLAMIPLWGIADVGACGTAAVFRRIAENRASHDGQVFAKAIRQNGAAAFVLGAARGVLLWLLLAAESFYAQLPMGRALQIAGVAVLLLILSAEGLLIPALHGSKGARKAAIRSALAGAVWHMPVCVSVIMLTVVLPAALLLIPRAGIFAWGIYQLVIGLSVRQCGFVCVAVLLGIGAAEPVEADEFD